MLNILIRVKNRMPLSSGPGLSFSLLSLFFSLCSERGCYCWHWGEALQCAPVWCTVIKTTPLRSQDVCSRDGDGINLFLLLDSTPNSHGTPPPTHPPSPIPFKYGVLHFCL